MGCDATLEDNTASVRTGIEGLTCQPPILQELVVYSATLINLK